MPHRAHPQETLSLWFVRDSLSKVVLYGTWSTAQKRASRPNVYKGSIGKYLPPGKRAKGKKPRGLGPEGCARRQSSMPEGSL
ncbi:hypothetical protein WMY93_027149 [Mugilogobius chulae]|uniref:Ribosomal protein L15 n=1 Tax=Mugilogobius chulae TaxID=88201 RepID=A0AAW0MTV8_9GOBI